MKRIIAVFLALLMMISVCSCEIGKKNSDDTDASSVATSDFDGTKIVASTENYSISFAELDYIFADTYNSMLYNYYSTFQDSYADYILYYTGLDINKPLKDQTMNDGSGTFFDYYLEVSAEKANDILIFCEYAKENGLDLDDDDREYIDGLIDTYKQQTEANNCTFAEIFEDSMGLITEEVVRSYSEKNILAGKGYNFLKETYSFTDEEVEAEFNANLKNYAYISYLVYTFQNDETAGITAEDIKTYSEELSAVTTEEEFIAYCENYHNNVLYKDMESHPEFSKDNLLKERIGYSKDMDYLDKLFEGKAGDTFVTENTGDDFTSYNVYMLVGEPSELNYSKVDVRHILFKSANYESTDACRKAAEDIYALYKQNPTEDNFAALANKYSEDTYTDENGNQTIAEEGGLIKDIGYNETVKDFENWALDPSRQVGDTDIILSTLGYHIVYFSAVGEKQTPGHDSAKNALISQRYEKDHEELKTKYAVTADKEYMANLNY